MHGQANIG